MPTMKQFTKTAILLTASIAFLYGLPSVESTTFNLEKRLRFNENLLLSPEVTTSSGIIIGSTLPESHAFYNIRYGKAPVGELRFQPPQEFTSSEKFNASEYNQVRCFEYLPNSTSLEERNSMYTEDCLVLNINVPASVDLSALPIEGLPVMLWIHGGSFSAGAGTDPLYDGRWLSNSTNTIVVRISYRLDVLGFLYYDENGEILPGNQGFKDQQLAMRWVQSNIAKFGGDSNKVTIFGNSAGAQGITFHLLSNQSDQLFQRAIMQSSPAVIPAQTTSEAQSFAQIIIDQLNCSSSGLQCLRDASAFDLMFSHLQALRSFSTNAFSAIEPFRPILDGTEFTEQPLDAFQAGRWQSNKEVIMGTTSEELFVDDSIQNSRADFEAIVAFSVGPDHAPAVISEYAQLAGSNPPDDYDYTDILTKLQNDMVFVCPNRLQARFMSADQNPSSVYFYVDSYPMASPNCEEVLQYCGSPYHTSEIYFIFNSGTNTGLNFSQNDTTVSKIFTDFWGYFAYNGKPSQDELGWPRYTSTALNSGTISPWSNIRITAPQAYVEDSYNEAFCDFWDSLNFYVTINSEASTPNPGIQSTTSGSASVKSWGRIYALICAMLLSLLYCS